MNETISKFNYPDSLIKEYKHWVILLRPKQVTLGSLVLACREEATAFPDLSVDAFTEMKGVLADLERALKQRFAYDKINYVMLMMVDKHVHFHVIPRYSSPRDFEGVVVTDAGWPKHPDMNSVASFSDEQWRDLRDIIRQAWQT